MQVKTRIYSGSKSTEVSARELENRKVARAAAAEGIVLMKNDGVLPIKKGQTAALYGNGVSHFIKGGTGSGDVNEREVVTIQEGLSAAGVTLVNEAAVMAAPKAYMEAKYAWRDGIVEAMNAAGTGSDMAFFQVLKEHPFVEPENVPVIPEEVSAADAVIYVISRIAGEGRDRFDEKGDYYLSDAEEAELAELAKYTQKIVVLINAGGQIDVKAILANPSVKGLLNISQGGMETGNAVADVLTGAVTPSGKLTGTWTKEYGDFPNSATFSHNNGNTDTEKYEEGIYVGYRYFDSFGVDVQYPFGYGLSYTSFAIKTDAVVCDGTSVSVTAVVTNTGKEYAGKEVVQIYAALPLSGMKKEYKRLIGFAKTRCLAPGESQTLTVTMPAKMLASFDESRAAWVIEAGEYAVLVGNSSADTTVEGILSVAQDTVMEQVTHICPLKEELNEIVRPDEVAEKLTAAWKGAAQEKGLTPIPFAPEPEKLVKRPEGSLLKKAAQIAEELTDEEITAMLMGEITKGQDNLKEDELVETGIYVPGAAGETSCALEKHGIPAISMADGPAGLRLMRSYDVDRASGKIYSQSLMAALENGLFAMEHEHQEADTYYMYATAIPIGTLLAQSFDTELLEKVGAMVGGEMQEFGVAWWLAPGMNIHRNPLCGRNFEYYSEDPLVAGVMAAAITRGVQSVPGVGTTIKHFACNNQEDNRLGSNTVISERALREIYLRGFEIAVKSSQPMCIMTSYNLINGVHAANSRDINTVAAREEWDFKGIIMTDWTTTTAGGSSPHGCALAGNDLIMPGHQIDVDDIKAALASGDLPRETARECCARLFAVIFQTLGMEDAPAYGAQFDVKPYVEVK